ncbi:MULTISPECIES: NYN domain-containing protein [unclassified Rathayibacter]|uniref:NYN domain-containing protein n=1 Tax=unclassified Rathayibacter TaxID=2609250 RepID=UPI0010519832|nr:MULTISPECIES: NYN domain-containing protein [unclassified Rathayibacter]MCJ1703121.1 NYN domain-containing protein [Rathayibacter sp. VKM Ac-2926]TCL82167.1 NYN domain-containing protein [Rathayibacter sp. PhB192]TCM27383.1 NYN domain-containing protein [Rathayibacter sp. PhB179]
MPSRRSVLVYVDGFALYKALLQRRYPQFKWLDLEALAQRLFPHRTVVGVKYFTAALKPMTNDRGIGQRQQVYWRALRTTSVEIIEGTFHFNRQFLPLHPEVLDSDGRVVTVRVKRPEEKGTDVALASHLLVDAFEGAADSFAVVTNDSDLVPPMRMLAERSRSLALVSVVDDRYNKAFASIGLETVRQIRAGTLSSSQFPDSLVDGAGRIVHRPWDWA